MKQTKLAIMAAATFMSVTAAPSQAITLFADNFNSYAPGLTITSLAPKWTITGNIDLVAQSNPYGIANCPGVCVDLDGTTGPGKMTTAPISFAAGKMVVVKFDVSGNQRGGANDNFIASVSFNPANGGIANPISGPAPFVGGGFLSMLNGTPYVESISPGRSFQTYSYWFRPVLAGTFDMSFATDSADNVGPILDNVMVGQVPEPATWAMLIMGFGMIGVAKRRRAAALA